MSLSIKRQRSSRLRIPDEDSDMLHLANLIKMKKQVVIVTGAGLSCASGIPPFRGSADAIWSSSLYEWGTKEKFLQDPLDWYRSFFFKHFTKIKDALPNDGHEAIGSIVSKYPDTCRVITQNIDLLHTQTVDVNHLIEIHGNCTSYRCFTDDCIYSEKQSVLLEAPIDSEDQIPVCPECRTMCCPTTLLFDEEYYDHEMFQFDKALSWLENAEVIIFVGTSFSVGITNYAFEAAQQRVQEDAFIELFDFNLHNGKPKSKGVHVNWNFIQGPCEKTLPKLNSLC